MNDEKMPDDLDALTDFMENSDDRFIRVLAQLIDCATLAQRKTIVAAFPDVIGAHRVAVAAQKEFEENVKKAKAEYLADLQAMGIKQRFGF